MRRLLLDRLFVCPRDGTCLTRPHGWFGSWRRVTDEQKKRLTELYLCAAEGTILLVAFGLYRSFFGDSIGYEDMFSVAGFSFGVSIFMAQAWLLADAPEVSGPGGGRENATPFTMTIPFPSLVDLGQAAIVVIAFFLGGCVLAAGLVLHEVELWVAGTAGVAISALLLRREMLRLWRSRR